MVVDIHAKFRLSIKKKNKIKFIETNNLQNDFKKSKDTFFRLIFKFKLTSVFLLLQSVKQKAEK